MSKDREDILRRVRLLLDKADSTSFEAEADSLRAKADELMFKYAIESFEIDKARGEAHRREKPVLRKFDVCKGNNPIKEQLIELVWAVAQHTRCRAVLHGGAGKSEYTTVAATVVGFPADTEYAEMLFTSLWAQMSSGIEPKPDPNLSYEQNVVMLMDSGQSRERVAELMGTPWTFQLGIKYSRMYRAWWEAEHPGEEYRKGRARPLPITYVRNFAYGFVTKVSVRMAEIRRRQEQDVRTTGKDIVLYDRDKEITDAFREFFPRLGTHKPSGSSQFNLAARNRGSAAGARADLGQPRVGGSRPALPGPTERR